MSFFNKKKDINIISNFGQIFDLIKNDKTEDEYSNKKEKILYLGDNDESKYFDINTYFGDLNVLNKYPKNKIKNEENNRENIDKNVYGFIEHDSKNKIKELIQNKELMIPLDEDDDNNKKQKKDFAKIHNKIDNTRIEEGLFKNIFSKQ